MQNRNERADDEKARVPGDATPQPREINEPLDEHESTRVAGFAVSGLVVGGVAGAVVGLIAAAFPVIDWWMGLMIGALCGLTASGLVMARLGLRSLEDESLPPDVRRHGETGLRG